MYIHFLLKSKHITLFIKSYHSLTLNVCLIYRFGQITKYIERSNNKLRYLVSRELSLEITPKTGLLL